MPVARHVRQQVACNNPTKKAQPKLSLWPAWLAGSNRPVQRRYWELFRDSRWPDYRVVAPAPGVDALVECDLAVDFDLSDPDALTRRIEAGTTAFIADMTQFLAERRV